MNYLVTGGLGLIGSQLANTIFDNVTIVSRTKKHSDRLKRKDVKLIIKPLSELDAGDIKNIDVIYHCASTVDNYNVLSDPYIDAATNINGTIHLLELCKDLKKKPFFIFLSTFFVYGNVYDQTKKSINEGSKTDPLALYPATKLCAESAVKLYSKLYDIPYLICRLTNVYGAMEDYDNKKKGALNYLIMRAVQNEPISVYKGGNFLRDYIYVDDVVSALMYLEKKARNDLYLIGYGTPIQFKKLMTTILKKAGSRSKISEIDPPFFHSVVGINNFVADCSKINSLGWHATIPPEKGVEKIVKRYQLLLKEM